MRRTLFLFLCLVLVLGLASCASKPREENFLAQSEPKMLVMASAVDLYNIDPAIGFDQAISSTHKNLYDSLYKYVGNPPRLIPWLAKGYDVSDDGLEWTFYLREDARFHDGSLVTANDVAYSTKRLMSIGKGPALLFRGIINENSTIIIDNHTVRFRLNQPYAPFIKLVPWLFVLNSRLVEEHRGSDYAQSWLAEHEAGSGPFTIKAWVPGEYYEFRAVENYWRGWSEKGRLAGYTRRIIRQVQDRIKALTEHEADMADWISPEDQLVLRDVNNMVLVDEPAINTYEIKMNNKKEYTADVHVRRAVSYAFDYDALKQVWVGKAELLQGPLPSGSKWLNKDLEVYRLNMTKAKEELSKSPWPKGGFLLDYVYVNGLEEERQTGLILKDQLAKLNITVNIIPVSWADAVTMFKNPNTSPNLFPLYSSSAFPDPDNYLWSGYHSSTAGFWTNPGYYQNPELDRIIEKARLIRDEKERKELYDKAQEIIVNDAVNIFGISPPDFHVFSPRIKGFDYCPVQGSDEDFYLLRLE